MEYLFWGIGIFLFCILIMLTVVIFKDSKEMCDYIEESAKHWIKIK